MVDIQSAMAEIRRGKKERQNKRQDENMMTSLFHREAIRRGRRKIVATAAKCNGLPITTAWAAAEHQH